MENFIVSARKYRPTRFDEVVGQEQVTETLKNAIKSQHVGHAFLFCGPRGVGKTTTARILAKTLNCENLQADGEACDACDSCKRFRENTSFNVHELDAASHNSVDEMRSLVEQVRYLPQQGKKKIYIIDEVHMLSTAAFNAFLKTLEEPPEYAVFILATTEKHKILPTILSRCQIYDFNRIQPKDIIPHLQAICKKEQIDCEPEALHIIALKADGALRDALSIFDKIVSFSEGKITLKTTLENLNVLDYDYYFKIIDALLSEDRVQTLLLFNEILNRGFDGEIFINGLSDHCRDLLICKHPDTLELLEIPDGLKSRYKEQAHYTSSSFLLSALDILNQFDVSYKMSRNKRLHVELALLKLCYLNRLIHPETLPAQTDAPSKKKPSTTPDPDPGAKLTEAPPEEDDKEKLEPVIGEDNTEPDHGEGEALINPVVTEAAPTRTVKSSLSLQDLKRKREAVRPQPSPAVSEEQAEAQEEELSPASEAEKMQYQAAWKKLASQLKEEGSLALATMVETHAILVRHSHQVILVIDNKSTLERLKQERVILSEMLARELNLPKMELKVKFDEEAAKKVPRRLYTAKERFEYLVEKNPQLKELKDRLDLELDF